MALVVGPIHQGKACYLSRLALGCSRDMHLRRCSCPTRRLATKGGDGRIRASSRAQAPRSVLDRNTGNLGSRSCLWPPRPPHLLLPCLGVAILDHLQQAPCHYLPQHCCRQAPSSTRRGRTQCSRLPRPWQFPRQRWPAHPERKRPPIRSCNPSQRLSQQPRPRPSQL